MENLTLITNSRSHIATLLAGVVKECEALDALLAEAQLSVTRGCTKSDETARLRGRLLGQREERRVLRVAVEAMKDVEALYPRRALAELRK